MTYYDEDWDGYSNEAQRHCGAIERGFASSPLKEDCACHGSGWILSDYDTWHHCPIHFQGQEGPAEFEMRCEQEEWWDSLSRSQRHAEMIALARYKVAKARELREEDLDDTDYIPF